MPTTNDDKRHVDKVASGKSVESPPRGGPPAYAIIGLLVALLLLGTGGFLWLNGEAGGPVVGGPFTLTNGDGQTVTDRDFRGKYMLVYFGYTYCPDVCPTTLNALADALDRLGAKADRLQPLFVTVDPRRDTPAVIKQYTAAFTPRIEGLTGTPAEIAAAAKEYHVYYAEHRTGPGPNDYSMDHSSILYLMAPDGRFIAPVRADETGAEIAADLTRLMS
jgi:protein SCO1/2